jgi:hypothetical protein
MVLRSLWTGLGPIVGWEVAMKPDRVVCGILGLFSACLLAVPLSAQTTLGPCMYFPTSISGVMKGKALINGAPAEAGDIISVWDERGHCAGAATVTIETGQATIRLPIYCITRPRHSSWKRGFSAGQGDPVAESLWTLPWASRQRASRGFPGDCTSIFP